MNKEEYYPKNWKRTIIGFHIMVYIFFLLISIFGLGGSVFNPPTKLEILLIFGIPFIFCFTPIITVILQSYNIKWGYLFLLNIILLILGWAYILIATNDLFEHPLEDIISLIFPIGFSILFLMMYFSLFNKMKKSIKYNK